MTARLPVGIGRIRSCVSTNIGSPQSLTSNARPELSDSRSIRDFRSHSGVSYSEYIDLRLKIR